jgi:Protein of unknown function (DUF3108)
MYAAAEKFFSKHLQGRHQEDMTPEVATRLKEITVDPKIVTLTKKIDPSAVGAPKPMADLKAGSSTYDTKLEVAGQTMSLSIARQIKEEPGGWVITESMQTPAGEASDTVALEKGTLQVRKRSIKQGPAAIELSFDNAKASGTVAMGGSPKPVSVDLGGPLYGDGPAMTALAVLPLAEGYTTTFRNFDAQKQKATLRQLKVTGTEDVTVPAGTFKAFKVEITSAEGEPGTMTLWVATDTRALVKIAATLPQMNGAKLTAELTKSGTQ